MTKHKASRGSKIKPTTSNKTRISLFVHPDDLEFIEREADIRRLNRSEMLRLVLAKGREVLESSIV